MKKEKRVVKLSDIKKYLNKSFPTMIDIRDSMYKEFEKMSILNDKGDIKK